MITMTCDVEGASAALDDLDAAVLAAVRPAAQAGAEVYYREVLMRVPVMAMPKEGKGGKVHQPGALKAAIYQAFSADKSTPPQRSAPAYMRAEYHVSWNASKAPHGHLVEYGHVQRRVVFQGADGAWYTSKAPLPAPRHVAARPFLRPAYEAAKGHADAAMDAEFSRRIQAALQGSAA